MAVFNDSARWKIRAEEARALANLLDDAAAREALFGIAAAYDGMAVKAGDYRKFVSPQTVGMAAE